MKISTALGFILVVSGVFFLFALMYSQGQTNYPNANLNNSAWNGQYDYASGMNSTIDPLYQKFQTIQDPNAGWFSKITVAISAVPYAIILLPEVVFGGISTAGKISTGLLIAIAIPAYIILLVVLYMLIWGLMKVTEFFQRVQV